MALLGVGEEFAGYTVVRLIGSGGMGEVYLAQHPRLPRREALKILRPEISSDDSFRQRFTREADSIAALEHPNIVTVHDRGDTDGQLWIATQFVDGPDAARLLGERYPAGMPADEVAAIAIAIADALDYAHDRGLLHRDVKPANILLTQPDRDGHRRIYLADFGIARPLDDPAGLTATNFTVGTVAYAAPEQLMGNPIDGRADQYALAASAYHLLTCRPLYPDSNPVAVISRHLAEPPPPPSRIRAELAPLDAVFARALAKEPEGRFLRCRDFARALSGAIARGGAGVSPSAPTQEAPVPPPPNEETRRPPTTPPAAKPLRERPNLVLIGAAAIVALTVVGALLSHPWTQQGPAPTSLVPPTPSTSISSPPSSVATTTSTTTTSTTTTPPRTGSAPPQPTYPPAGVLGSACPPPGGAIGTGPDGAIYYCARVQYTDGYEWSLTPGVIPNTLVTVSPQAPAVPSPGNPCPTIGADVYVPGGVMQCDLDLRTNSGVWDFIPTR
ncbi:MAG TPA: protein kinase [Mycobacterium sp.]|nr:protein kinase [Mycobacterium sp.]